MPKFKLFYGLGGGFGGAREYEGVHEFKSEEEAMLEAYQMSCEEYESYAGLHGLRSVDDIMEEDGVEDFDEAEEVYREERESWLDYYVEEIK